MRLQIVSPRSGLALVGAVSVAFGGDARADGGDAPGTGPVITGAQIQATTTITGDTSDNTDFADSGTPPFTDCTAGAAPDEWYTIQIGATTGTLFLDVTMCEGSTNYDSKIYLRDDQGDVIVCNDEGCGFLTGPSALVNVVLAPGTYELAIDGFASSAGAYSAIVREFGFIGCFLDPCGGTPEGEPCDEIGEDTTNGGCNSTPNVFGSITMDGPSICGVNWGNSGGRDTDWFAFTVADTTGAEVEVHAQTNTIAAIVRMSAGGVCPVLDIPEGAPAFSGDCDSHTIISDVLELPPGNYALFVGTGNEDGTPVFDGFPCPDGSTTNNAYEVELRSAPLPPPPCPWDLNGNGDVDFADILQVIGNWGPCPTG
jgi:hypothetical protein